MIQPTYSLLVASSINTHVSCCSPGMEQGIIISIALDSGLRNSDSEIIMMMIIILILTTPTKIIIIKVPKPRETSLTSCTLTMCTA